MLKQRIITAAILLPIVIAVILFGSYMLLAGLFGLVVLLGAWEWAGLSGVQHKTLKGLYVVVTLLVSLVLFFYEISLVSEWLYGLAVCWWLFACVWIVSYRPERSLSNGFPVLLVKLLIGMVVLIPAWLGLVDLHRGVAGPAYVLYLFAIIWGSDIGAYFAGKKFGSRKLMPNVSPGKTLEGLLGALVATCLIALLGIYLLDISSQLRIAFIFLSIVVSILSVAGDLFESLMKRQAGVKDSGSLLPGHGGILDRIDSVTAAVPVFIVGAGWLL